MKLTAVLLGFLVVSSALSTLIPQKKPPSFYEGRYPAVSDTILLMNIDTFFRSPVFLVPVFLFFVNLCVCTAGRLAGKTGRRHRRSFGPDIIHIGLILLLVSGVVSLYGRKEGYISLGVGESTDLFGKEQH